MAVGNFDYKQLVNGKLQYNPSQGIALVTANDSNSTALNMISVDPTTLALKNYQQQPFTINGFRSMPSI